MNNYFRVSKGVRDRCPLSPLVFILCVEILAQKIRQNPKITEIELTFSCEVKLSQFADDTSLICKVPRPCMKVCRYWESSAIFQV